MPPGPERLSTFQRVSDEGSQLEGIYGRPTARTLAMRGVAMIGLKRYPEAVPLLEASLNLRGGRHPPLQKLGVALWRCGRLPEAEQRLQEALQVRPFAWNTCYTLAQVARDRGDFETAYAWAAKVPVVARDELDWKQPHLVGGIAVNEAVTFLAKDPARARAAAVRAAEAYAAAAAAPSAVAMPARQQRLQVNAQLAQALQAEDLETALLDYLNVTRQAPDDPYTIAIVAHLLPERGFGPQQSWMMRVWLRELARALAGGDEKLWKRLGEEIDELAENPPR
jgi:tetratricopeptide (TPR) repeat protein